jgi:hypothetical protein
MSVETLIIELLPSGADDTSHPLASTIKRLEPPEQMPDPDATSDARQPGRRAARVIATPHKRTINYRG